jgi:DDE superfamily endonuclease
MIDALFDHYEDRENDTRELAEEAIQQQNQIDVEEVEENPARVCWLHLCNDDRRCKILTGFTPDEFLDLFDLIEENINENIGRGARSKFTKQDKLVIMLCYLKHYETIDKMKDTFSISRSYLHTLLETTIDSIMPVLYDYFVTNLQDRVPYEPPDPNQPFPNAKYVMDATFQRIWTPVGSFNEKKRYFSGKHNMYGLKSQCIHDRQGRIVHCIAGIRGAIHDLTICRDNIAVV